MNEMSKVTIGNVVEMFTGKNGWKPITVDLDDMTVIHRDGTGYRPIPITPEILEKCGFVMQGFNNELWLTIGQNQHMIWDGEMNLWLGDYYILDEVSPIPVPCPHLHTLQNLFHSLTGKELAV